jgi:1-acyl-sn-glycerol-3-phosphate acyltransferase
MNVAKSILVWSIAIFFIGVLFPVVFVIWVIVLPFDRERRLIHRILIWQSLIIIRLAPVWKIKIEGRKKAAEGVTYVIISNHQSVLDILMLNCLRYRYKWISKIEIMRVPVLGWYLRMADYITVNRGDEESKAEMLEKSLECLQDGCSIMIFPEGTRSLTGDIGFFKRGAFLLAIQASVPILPVVLDGTSDILPKHGLMLRSGYNVRIRVLDPVMPAEFGTNDPDELASMLSSIMRSELHLMKEEKSYNDPQSAIQEHAD